MVYLVESLITVWSGAQTKDSNKLNIQSIRIVQNYNK